jgi:hypothetical protein
MYVLPSLFSREEEEPERAVANDGWGHAAIVADARGQAA